jgi:cell division protein FtsW
MRRIRATSSPDYIFLGVLSLLIIVGFVILASASSDLAKERFGDGYYYLTQQFWHGFLVGIVGFLGGLIFCYRRWERFALILFILSVALLTLVFTPLGVTSGGASRWVEIGGISFQPSEILKITYILYLASWISKNKERRVKFFEGFVPFAAVSGALALLLFKQPTTTTAVLLLAAAVAMYFASGARTIFVFLLVLVAGVGATVLVYTSPYRLERVLTFLNPESADVLREGYHREQTLIAVGSGGITGVGYGKSTTKLHYLPEPIGDSIFAVVAEELGFAGSVTLITLFFILMWRGLAIARKAPDTFGKLAVVGFTVIVALQTFIHIGATSGLLPLTGVPLPFVSFGGTSLAVFMTMAGITANVSRYRR